MGLLAKMHSLGIFRPSGSGLAARARAILSGAPASTRANDGAIDALIERATTRSVLCVYDLAKTPDAAFLVSCAKKIVGRHGSVIRTADDRLAVLLTHMENADPGLALSQFGKSMSRALSEAAHPLPGKAMILDPDDSAGESGLKAFLG